MKEYMLLSEACVLFLERYIKLEKNKAELSGKKSYFSLLCFEDLFFKDIVIDGYEKKISSPNHKFFLIFDAFKQFGTDNNNRFDFKYNSVIGKLRKKEKEKGFIPTIESIKGANSDNWKSMDVNSIFITITDTMIDILKTKGLNKLEKNRKILEEDIKAANYEHWKDDKETTGIPQKFKKIEKNEEIKKEKTPIPTPILTRFWRETKKRKISIIVLFSILILIWGVWGVWFNNYSIAFPVKFSIFIITVLTYLGFNSGNNNHDFHNRQDN